jgi:hypothetical protein
MPDLSMCRNRTCPSRGECFRYRAMPSQRQSITSFAPVLGEDRCDFFVKIMPGDRLNPDGEANSA